VIDAPDDNRIIEFKSGISIGWKMVIPSGGQFIPISILGDTLLLKKAQKNLKKNITSEVINIIILLLSKFEIVTSWCP
jgi:hypothetical protein